MSNLKKIVSQIDKQFGAGAAVLLGDSDIAVAAEVISTGSPAIDRALVIGGLPRGRVVEVYGPPSGGKTTITLQTVAQAQKMGLNAAFVDVENALDAQYAANLGVDTKNLIVSQPDYGEQALEITESLIRTGELGIVVVDSVAALVPKAELEGEMGQAQMGLQARMMSQAMRKLNKAVASTNVVLIFINQIRYKLGVMFGSPETTTAGEALKFYSSIRMDIRRTQAIKSGEEVIGASTRVKIVKNKLAAPFKIADVSMIYGEGVSRELDIIKLGVEAGILEKSGAWYSHNGEKLACGQENLRKLLKESPSLTDNLAEEIMTASPQTERAAQPEAEGEEL